LKEEHVLTALQKKAAWAEISVPIIEKKDCERVAPGVRRTLVALNEGQFTAGNLLWAKTSAMRKLLPKVRAGYDNRKSPLKLAGIVGTRTAYNLIIAKLFPKRVTVASLAQTVSQQMGIQIEALIVHDAEIGTDVDRYSQLEALLALQEPRKTTAT
ncbi:MAG: hypothetical protein ABUL72_06420, partial [Armatimonadota bacterium]